MTDIPKATWRAVPGVQSDPSYAELLDENDRLRAGLIAGAEQVKKLAFEMPPPNDYTPQFVMLAQSMERYANQQRTEGSSK